MEEDKRAMTSAPIAIQSDLRAAVPATPIAQRTPLNTKESLSPKQRQSPGKEGRSHIITQKDPSSPRVTMSAQDAAILNNKELDALLSASGEAGGEVFPSPQQEVTTPPIGGASDSMLLRQANQISLGPYQTCVSKIPLFTTKYRI